MKAIIIAAGLGSRLKEYTLSQPKCLLKVQGKSILEYQLEAFTKAGIQHVSLVKGYLAEQLNFPQLGSYLNQDYQNNNILSSLMCAEADMDDGFIASYSDIIYDASIVQALLNSPHDISLVVDRDWQSAYCGRTDHPESEAEKVVCDSDGQILKIGKHLELNESVSGEFIGLLKCTAKGAQIFRQAFYKAKSEFEGRPFGTSSEFKKAYFPDLVTYLSQSGVPIYATFISGGWREIDTEQDLLQANAWKAQECLPVTVKRHL